LNIACCATRNKSTKEWYTPNPCANGSS